MRVPWRGVLAVGAVLAVPAGGRPHGAPATAPPAAGGPRYVGDSLVRPEGIERWVLAGASLGLGYSEPSGAEAAGVSGALFHNVYIEPSAKS